MVCVLVVQKEGLTALHWAASAGHVDVVKALLAAGANVTARNVRGDEPGVGAGTGCIAVSVEWSDAMISWSVVGIYWRGYVWFAWRWYRMKA